MYALEVGSMCRWLTTFWKTCLVKYCTEPEVICFEATGLCRKAASEHYEDIVVRAYFKTRRTPWHTNKITATKIEILKDLSSEQSFVHEVFITKLDVENTLNTNTNCMIVICWCRCTTGHTAGISCVHLTAILVSFLMYSFPHNDLRMLFNGYLIHLEPVFRPYWYWSPNTYGTIISATRWEPSSTQGNDNDWKTDGPRDKITDISTLRTRWSQLLQDEELGLTRYRSVKVNMVKLISLFYRLVCKQSIPGPAV